MSDDQGRRLANFYEAARGTDGKALDDAFNALTGAEKDEVRQTYNTTKEHLDQS